MNKEKIGFFGGCFNPPTIAHIELAKLALKEAKLDKIIFIPMGNYYPKEGLIDVKHRYQMLKLATSKEKDFYVSDMQFNQNRIVYAIESFEEVNEKYKNCDKYFIMGYDNFSKISKWHQPEKLKKFQYIVFEREEKIEKSNNVFIIKNDKFKNVSSKKIRQSIKNGKNNSMIDENVFKYIQENKLYQ